MDTKSNISFIYKYPKLYSFFDSFISFNLNNTARRLLESILENIIEESSSILDIGSGYGSFSKEFLKKYNVSYADIIFGIDATKLLFKDNSFDYCTFVFSLGCFDQIKALQEAKRVCRKGIFILDYNYHIPRILKEIGYLIFKCYPPILPEKYKIFSFYFYNIYLIKLY